MTDRYTIAELGLAKGTSRPVAEALLAMERKIAAQAAEIEKLRDKIVALTDAGDKLATFACHDDLCQIMVNGVWSDPIPCTCGYRTALTEWKAATNAY